jgi:hypothetical protein
VLLAGLLVGAGLAFLIHINEDSFAVSDQLSEAFNLPILGSVTMVGAVSQRLEMRRAVYAVAGAFSLLMVCYGILILMSQLHPIASFGGAL